jgi:pyruvate ferredoxin oxidoreductase beta subunit
VHILSVCPTGWRIPPSRAIWIGRLAVETGVFPLYEVENGKHRITLEVPEMRPVLEYLKPQGRFRHLTPAMIDKIQERVTRDYHQLKLKTTR